MLEVLEKLDGDRKTPALVEVCIPEKDLAPQIQRLADPTGSLVEACQNNASQDF